MTVNKWLVALTVMLPTLIEIIDMSIVIVSLGHIRGSLSAGVDESTWIITSYLVSNAVIIPMSGWLSRLVGRKKYLILSVSLFTLSSLMCGSSRSLNLLIIFRILQGIAGGGLQPLAQAILLETFPVQQHGIAMAIYGIGIMFGPIIGPLLGGWITDNWSWPWIFYINVPIGILSVIMAIFFIIDPPYMKAVRMKIDFIGILLLAIGIGCLQFILDRGERYDWFASDLIFWLAIMSLTSLTLFIVVELLFAEHPVVNLRLFREISFTMGNIIMFFTFFNLFGSITLLPIYVQTLMGYTATLAGLVLAPGGVATMITMPVVGRFVNLINPKLILALGILICSYSTNLMSGFNLNADFISIAWPRIVLGFGMGFTVIPLMTLTLSSIKKEEMGNATAIFNTLRNLGGSFGVAFVTTMISRHAQMHHLHLVEHMSPFDYEYQRAVSQAAEFLFQKGWDNFGAYYAGLASIYKELIRQATMMAFNDAFYMLSIFMILTLPLLILIGRN